MTATSLGLNGQPVKFLGAYVKAVSSNLGMSVNPSTISVTLAEDDDARFIQPTVGTFHTLQVGPTWEFSGVITRFELDLAQTGGRLIRVTLADPREIMKSVPVIIAPGYSAVVAGIDDTGCSLLDIFGAFDIGGGVFNLSGWNQAGIEYVRLESALNGDNVRFGETIIPVPQQVAQVFGETYRFNISNITDRILPDYRINTNLVPISSIIEDISNKHSFDWFVTSSRAADGIIDVVVKIIDRATDNIDIGLRDFLNDRIDRVVTATSGIELRNELSCLAMQGAPVEQLRKVEIKGLANEPIDLTAESGSNRYTMTETEIRIVLGGRNAWEFWLASPVDVGGGGGFSRYGGSLADSHVEPIVSIKKLFNIMRKGGVPGNDQRSRIYLDSDRFENAGKVFTKLEGKAKDTYGKRWVHNDIGDDIIDTAWTRDVLGGNEDPNEVFRQDDGRTRAYVEFTSEEAGGAFSLGLSNLNNLFGDQNIFRNITRFGNTFENVLDVNSAILVCELASNFNPTSHVFKMEKSNYTYNDAALEKPVVINPTLKSSLYVAANIDKDGVVKIPAPVFEARPDIYQVLNIIVQAGLKEAINSVPKTQKVNVNEGKKDKDGKPLPELLVDQPIDADGRKALATNKVKNILRTYFGASIFGISARCFQPDFAYIPTRSKVIRYGPVFSAALAQTSQGKLEIIQDDGFAPWEFGSISLMIDAMQRKVDNATSTVREVFSASISVEGFPELNLGDSLEKNSNITSMSISFGDGGVKTQYNLQTFTRKFGQFTKEDWARISLYANGSATRTLPQQQIGFVQGHRFGVDKKITGRGNAGGETVTGGGNSFG